MLLTSTMTLAIPVPCKTKRLVRNEFIDPSPGIWTYKEDAQDPASIDPACQVSSKLGRNDLRRVSDGLREVSDPNSIPGTSLTKVEKTPKGILCKRPPTYSIVRFFAKARMAMRGMTRT